MPPRKKQLTPKQLEHEFDRWTSSPEYKLREQILKEYSRFDELLEITPDLVDKLQPLFDLIAQIPSTFRIRKTKIRAIQQEQLRTAFFGGVQQRDEPFRVDDTPLDFQNKDVPKNCRHVKKTFVHLLNILADEHLGPSNFLSWRKDKLIYRFREFAGYFKEHVKKGHPETKTLMLTGLDPLLLLMRANLKLVVFELSARGGNDANGGEGLARQFYKYRANIIDFCRSYQPVQDILFE